MVLAVGTILVRCYDSGETPVKSILINAALVGTGGFIGAIFRFGVNVFFQRFSALNEFPYGTLAVNMLGCFFIGLTVGAIETRHLVNPEIRSFIIIGLLGGFTTYSAFGLETFILLRDAELLKVVSNVAIHIIAGLFLVWVGYSLTSK